MTILSTLWTRSPAAVAAAALVLSFNIQILCMAQDESPFSIIFDGGSTGSRLHVFEFVEQHEDDDELECIRRGSFRVDQPLSAFAAPENDENGANATALAQHLMPALEFAAHVVPHKYHALTRVYYQATAGMRLLTMQQQEDVYDAVYQGLFDSDDFVFSGMRRSDVGTLSGDLEGYYGALAANYLKGTIGADLHMIESFDPNNSNDKQHHAGGPVGALDMGGSSTQIVFLPGARPRADFGDANGDEEYQYCSINDDANTTPSQQQQDGDDIASPSCTSVKQPVDDFPSRLDDKDFFSTSYLSYGVDQFRERLWTTWVSERKRQILDDECDSKILPNPCCFKGYEIEWDGYTLVGTGDTQLCIEEIQRLIPHPEQDTEFDNNSGAKRVVGGVEHPPVRGKFFAMSLYFFTLDSLRVLSQPNKKAYEALNLSWPTPSIQELHDALDGLCSRSWKGDLEDIQHEAHAYTRPEVLPHRCLESVYMVTLLKDGFGFAPESRDITFTFLVDGSEVEWTLGMALALRAQQVDELLAETDETSSSFVLDTGKRKNDTLEEEKEDSIPSAESEASTSFTAMLDRLLRVVSY